MMIEGFSPVESSEKHLEAYGEAKFDSGIGSMPDTVSKSKEQDDDKRSIIYPDQRLAGASSTARRETPYISICR